MARTVVMVFSLMTCGASYGHVDPATARALFSGASEKAALEKELLEGNFIKKVVQLESDPGLTPKKRAQKLGEWKAERKAAMKALLTTVQKGKKLFPCDLPADKKNLPEIIVIGENHETDAANKTREFVIDQMKSDKALVGLEAIAFGDASTAEKHFDASLAPGASSTDYGVGLNGLEDARAYALSGTARKAGLIAWAQRQTPPQEEMIYEQVVTLVAEWATSPTFRAGFSPFKNKLSASTGRLVLSTLLSSKVLSQDEAVGFLSVVDKKGYFAKSAKWPAFMRDFIELAIEDLYGAKEKAALKKAIDSLMAGESVLPDLVERVEGPDRSVHFAVNAAKMYCDALKRKPPRPLYLLMGAEHVSDVAEILREAAGDLPVEAQFNRDVLAKAKESHKKMREMLRVYK